MTPRNPLHETLSRVGVLVALAAGFGSACAFDADMKSALAGSYAGRGEYDAAAAAAPNLGSADGSLPTAPTKRGSVLCGIEFTCTPDELAPADCTALPDAGAPDGDAAAAPAADSGIYDNDAGGFACRVARRAGEPTPVCTVAGEGGDGAACRGPTDCAAGFECVGDPGQCRRYCCLGADSCGNDHVCDKRLVVGGDVIQIPVCVPVQPCVLLSITKLCPNGETCAIADQTDGRTSCIAIGTAKVGESCEEQNCEGGLTCLGSDNQRTCFKLCSKNGDDCAEGEECKGQAPLFSADQGVCIPDMTAQNQKH